MAAGKTKKSTAIKRLEARYFKKKSFIKRSSSVKAKIKVTRGIRPINTD